MPSAKTEITEITTGLAITGAPTLEAALAARAVANVDDAAWERLGRQEDESPAASYRRLRRTMLEAERQVFVQARDDGRIDDEVLFRVLRELDLEEAAISRE